MVKALFVCLCFAPDNSVASIRPTKLAKYLHKDGGYQIDLLKLQAYGRIQDALLAKDLEHVDRVFEIPQKYIATKAYGGGKTGLLQTLLRKSRSLREHCAAWQNDRQNLRLAKRYLNTQLPHGDYDVIFSSSGPFLTHKVAALVKKRCPGALWIADYRDPVPNTVANTALLRWIARGGVRRVTKRAERITGATAGCYQDMGVYAAERCMEVTTGFDRDDVPARQDSPDGKFSLSYTGTLHSRMSDVSAVFRALGELIAEGVIDRERCVVRYAGRMTAEFRRQAAKYDLQALVESYGYVERNLALAIQRQSHILLLASFNDAQHKDVITGKFYEYLLAHRPILCTVQGSVAGSRLKRLITELRCGYCWEAATGEADYPGLKRALKEQYLHYIHTGGVDYRAEEAAIERFDYRNIAAGLRDALAPLLAERKKERNP